MDSSGNGLVVKSTGSWYDVKTKEGKIIPCKIRGNYRIKGIRATNPVAVGDHVSFKGLDDEAFGMITHIGERKNYIIRRATNLSKEYQLIASNIDLAILMLSLSQPKTQLAFVDRFLVAAEAFRIPVLILFNKIDIYSSEELSEMEYLLEMYNEIGYKTLALSLHTGKNLEEVEDLMRDSVCVIAGNSGVGKSTLLNSLDPDLDLKTGLVSEYHKAGQHTTTNAEMFFLSNGACLIDTPGIKGFGTVDIDKKELFHFFPEIFKASSGCKFHNCMHLNEPDCAVLKAVEQGSIGPSRYMNYLSMMEDADNKYR